MSYTMKILNHKKQREKEEKEEGRNKRRKKRLKRIPEDGKISLAQKLSGLLLVKW